MISGPPAAIDANHAGNFFGGLLGGFFCGLGADHFVFAPFSAPTLLHLPDYSFARGDTFGFSAPLLPFHGLAEDVSLFHAADSGGATLPMPAPTTAFGGLFNGLVQLPNGTGGAPFGDLAAHLAQFHGGMLM